ncbi:MAG: A/G-specific adenine glycosylase [Crocinitomicaceae bacterium]|nr:A/G-specific adenine glycosylase [Crocinitomicaceae bacterium]
MDFTTSIQKWYRQNQRELPWRSTNNPYHIWLSEVILQQTRVEQGMPYYLRFVEKFPRIKDLANAPEDEVLNLWQGLGYYSRARNLHAAAKTVLQKHKGVFPSTYREIIELKGVGEYTAAAVASIAFDLPHAVVDGNVYRVLSRVFKISTPIDSSAGKKEFQLVADELVDPKNPGIHNQALMEIGSLICTPSKPDCENCPLNHLCMSFADKTYLNFPVKQGKTKVRKRNFHYLIITDGKKVILKKRTEKDIWIGLYDFRLMESDETEKQIEKRIRKLDPVSVKRELQLTHILSHQKIEATFWYVSVKKIVLENRERSVNIKDLDQYPMPRLLIRYLESKHCSLHK